MRLVATFSLLCLASGFSVLSTRSRNHIIKMSSNEFSPDTFLNGVKKLLLPVFLGAAVLSAPIDGIL